MIFLAAFFIELLVLFLLARALTMHLSIFLYRIGIGERGVMHILAVLFLPGTFLHEFSHYLMCVVLRVKVFGMSLLPKQVGEHQIKMGSLEHAKADLFRELLIGAAPFIIGCLILFTLLSYFTSHNPIGLNWETFLVGLVVFQIGNTMFSSKKDMEGSFKFLLILAAIFGISYLLFSLTGHYLNGEQEDTMWRQPMVSSFGFRISIEQLDQSIPSSLVSLVKQADLFLLIPIIIDLFVIGLVYGMTNLNKVSKF